MRSRSARRMLAGALLVALFGSAEGADESPAETLRRFLGAFQRREFSEAYDSVSREVHTDPANGQRRSREEWAKSAHYLFNFSDGATFDFCLLSARIQGDVATVPNVLFSQDRFLRHFGREIYELYTLVRENGAWKVDRHQNVEEPADIAKYFSDTDVSKCRKGR